MVTRHPGLDLLRLGYESLHDGRPLSDRWVSCCDTPEGGGVLQWKKENTNQNNTKHAEIKRPEAEKELF